MSNQCLLNIFFFMGSLKAHYCILLQVFPDHIRQISVPSAALWSFSPAAEQQPQPEQEVNCIWKVSVINGFGRVSTESHDFRSSFNFLVFSFTSYILKCNGELSIWDLQTRNNYQRLEQHLQQFGRSVEKVSALLYVCTLVHTS